MTVTGVRPVRTGPTARQIVLGVGAGTLLAVLVAALPLLLLLVAPVQLPEVPPSWESLSWSLMSADDGTVLRLVVTLTAWTGWAVFALAAVLEVVAVARRRPTPRLPALGPVQRGAAALVAAVLVLITTPAVSQAATTTRPGVGPPTGAAVTAPAVVTPPAAPAAVDDRPRLRAGGHGELPRVLVRRHDTLWGLAERHLGSGTRYPEIVALNRDRPQPDGRRLTDAHWIYPGWELRLPADASGTAVRADPPSPVTRQVPPDATHVDRGPLTAQDGTEPSALIRQTAAPTLVLAAGVTSADAADTADDSPADVAPLTAALGLGAVTAAGILAEITRQRRRAERTRPTGRHGTARPAPEERLLRTVAASPVAERVRAGLALLADGCRLTGRELPRVALVRARPGNLDLLLADDDPAPVPPFARVGPRTWRWEGPLQQPLPDPDRVDPCPALVSVGRDGPDLVLVNLDAAGTFHVAADPETARPVLTAMTVDLASRARAGGITLAAAPDLAAGGGAVPVTGDEAAALLARHQDAVSDVLGQAAVSDVATARSAGVAEETWAPQVVVAPELAAAPPPWSGAVAVTRGQGSWSLRPDADGSQWRLQPEGVPVLPQRLAQPDAATVDRMLTPTHPAAEAEPAMADLVPAVRRMLTGIAVPETTGADGAPYVRVLGPVSVGGVDDALIPGRVRRATELVAYLALHPGTSRHELDEAMWPGRRVGRSTRNPFVSRTRQWLGRADDGRAYLPLVADEGEYRLLPEVGVDWYDFVRLALHGLETPRPGSLDPALALVRGRPFHGIDPAAYAWAEADAQDMVAAIVDVAHVAAGQHLAAGDGAAAARAAARGLLVEPCSEKLHRDAIRAAVLRGDRVEATRAVARMHAAFEALDIDDELMPETQALLRELHERGRT